MKKWTILAALIIILGFVYGANPIISISVTPTNGEVGSSYTATFTNNANRMMQGVKFYFGTNEIAPIPSTSCPYNNGTTLKASEQIVCKFTVPNLPFGEYPIRVGSKVMITQAADLFRIINLTHYQEMLSKIEIGTKIPDEYSLLIGDGEYQGYAINSNSQISNCESDGLRSIDVNYEAVVTIKSGKISSVKRGKTTNPVLEICIKDESIEKIQNSTNPTTTISEELEKGNVIYGVRDVGLKVKIAIMQFVSSLLGGKYIEIAKILSYAK